LSAVSDLDLGLQNLISTSTQGFQEAQTRTLTHSDGPTGLHKDLSTFTFYY